MMYLAWVSFVFVFCNDQTIKDLALSLIITGQILSCIFTKLVDVFPDEDKSDNVSNKVNNERIDEKQAKIEKDKKSRKEMDEKLLKDRQNAAKIVWNGELSIIEPEQSSDN